MQTDEIFVSMTSVELGWPWSCSVLEETRGSTSRVDICSLPIALDQRSRDALLLAIMARPGENSRPKILNRHGYPALTCIHKQKYPDSYFNIDI